MKILQCIKALPKKICDAWISHLAVVLGTIIVVFLYQFVFGPPENVCRSERKIIMGKFHYKWDVDIYNHDGSRLVVYPGSDFLIRSKGMDYSEEVYDIQPIGKFDNGNYLGFLVKYEKPKNKFLNFKFKTYSNEPLKDNSCENFLFTL